VTLFFSERLRTRFDFVAATGTSISSVLADDGFPGVGKLQLGFAPIELHGVCPGRAAQKYFDAFHEL
jgi:hypothetical protein